MANRPVSNSQAAEAEAAAREAAELPTPPGQDQFDQYCRDKAYTGMEESGMPPGIFKGQPIDERPMVTRNDMREMFPVGMGIGRVPDHIIKKYGINLEKEVPRFVHENNYGHMGVNFLDNWLGDNPSGRVPTVGGKYYEDKGSVLTTLPIEVQESIDEDFNKVARNLDKGIVGDPNNGPFDLDDLSDAEMKQRREAAREEFALMFQNSPTQGKSLEEAALLFSDEEANEIQARYRWRGAGRREGAAESASRPGARMSDNTRDVVTEATKDARKGRSGLHSMGAGFDKNGKLVRS